MQVIVERYLPRVLLGQRVDGIAAISQAMDDIVASNLYAKAAVEVALHDAWARSLAVPVHTLLGGLARTSIPVTWALGTESAPEVIAEAQAKLDARRHLSFKLKMGAEEPADDVDRVVRIAEKLAGYDRRSRRHQRPLGPADLPALASPPRRSRRRAHRAARTRPRDRARSPRSTPHCPSR